MKPFSAIDLTTDKKNETANGIEFCTAKPSEALTRSFEDATNQTDDTLNKAKLPLPLRIVQTLSLYVWLITFVALLKSLGNVESLDVAYRNADWVFWLCGIAFVIWLVLKIFSKRHEISVLRTEDSELALSRLESVSNAILNELSVPANARETDVLSFFYKEKNGKLKHVMKGTSAFNYLNLVYHVYADEENLYLTNLDGRYTFPKASLKAIRMVKQSGILASWNKEAPMNEGFYKQFKLQTNSYGCVIDRKHYILELEKDGETWGIYFPSYELPTFEVLTGLKAE